MGYPERQALIQQIEKTRKSRLICFMTSDRQNADALIRKDAIPFLYEHLQGITGAEGIDLLLFTNGGDTLAAFAISRLLREFCGRIGVLVPLRCHSAGTLLALGANEIMMTRGATLSPVDPSLVGPLNPAVETAPGQRQIVPLSVESVAGFKGLVTEDWGLKGEDVQGIALKILAERVHPLALGDVYRARQQIQVLAKKLLLSHRSDEVNIGRIVKTLTSDLGSHDYPISRSETRELLGSQVCNDDNTLEKIIWDLFRDYSSEMELGIPYDQMIEIKKARRAGIAGVVRVKQLRAMIETKDGRDVAERESDLTEVQLPMPMPTIPGIRAQGGMMTGVREDIIFAGWRHYP